MIGLKDMLLAEQKRLEELIRVLQRQLRDAPEGTLRLSSSKHQPQYYHCTKTNQKNGTYISKQDMAMVQQLAQKTYDETVLYNSSLRRITQGSI